MPLDLNNPNNQYLVQSGFSVDAIEKSPTLVDLLNRFQGTLIIDDDNATQGVGAKASGNTIHISKSYNNFLNIAHELGHATGQYQQINLDKNKLYQFENPKAYGMARAKAEGEATYYEFLVAKELGYQKFNKPLWLDNEAKPVDKDVFNEVNQLVESNVSLDKKITKLAELNQSMLPSGQLHAPLYTYDEYNTLVFLNNRFVVSRISQDYEQIFDKPFDWNTYEAKSLANKANHHYGMLGNDFITDSHTEGSVLGQQGQGDLLWGSQGNDILVGNLGKDILLGGEGDDVLVGGKGNDTLAGGKGDDVYYFTKGFGKDTIINKGDGMGNVYFADIALEQLALISKENQNLQISIVNNDGVNDELNIKDFFDGGDNANLSFSFGQGGHISSHKIFSDLNKTNPNPSPTGVAESESLRKLDKKIAWLKQNIPTEKLN